MEPDNALPVMLPPRRVVSLVPSMTETLFDLNVGDRVVGRTDYCVLPRGQVEEILPLGGTKNPDVERILALRPDLVIVNREENRPEDVTRIREAGINVWVTFPRTVSEACNLLWDVMRLFDEGSMAPRVRLIEQTYDWLQMMSVQNSETLPRVFVPIWYDPLMTFNADTYMHDLLKVCGGLNVFSGRDRLYPLDADLREAEPKPAEGRDIRYPRITIGEVLAAQPDVIILPSEPYRFTEEHAAYFGKLDVPAAHHNRIHLIDGSLLTWHGTRMAYAFDQLPALFHRVD